MYLEPNNENKVNKHCVRQQRSDSHHVGTSRTHGWMSSGRLSTTMKGNGLTLSLRVDRYSCYRASVHYFSKGGVERIGPGAPSL